METTEACLQGDQDEARFDLIQGAIVIDGQAVGFWGARGVQNLFLGAGKCFDLTCGVGGADRLYLQGCSADHQVRVCAESLTLWHAAHGTEVKLHASRGPRELVFDDGTVTLGALWRGTRQASALLGVVGEASAGARATVANHVCVGPRIAAGALPEGALLQLEGLSGVETVYAGGSSTQVHLAGKLAEHKAQISGRALVISRRSSGHLETAYVVGPARLAFADGGVPSEDLFRAVERNEPWPLPQGEILPALPRITAVALDVDSADLGWPEDGTGEFPSGLFGGCRVGQVFEASVSLEEPVHVDGTPRLHMCVGGRHRAAQFSGGSGTNTLRFVYTVTEEDVAQGAGSETKGLTLTGRANLDVEVGPMITAGAWVRAVQPSLLPPDAPEAHLSAPVVKPDESGWQALIDESERRLAVALAMLEEGDDGVVSGRRGGHVRPDLEIELTLDVDLFDLEMMAELAQGQEVPRRPAALLADQAH